MTTSIPAPTSNVSTAGTPGTSPLLDAFTAAFAGAAGGPPAGPGQAGSSFAAWLAAPGAVNPPAGMTASPAVGAKSVALGRTQIALNTGSPVVVAPSLGAQAGSIAIRGFQASRPATIKGTAKGAALAATDLVAQPAQSAVNRDLIETVAALLAPVLQSLQSQVRGQNPVEATPGASTLEAPAKNAIMPATGFTAPAILEKGADNGETVAGHADQANPVQSPASGADSSGPLVAMIDFGSTGPVVSVSLSGLTPSSGQIPQSAADLRQALTTLVASALAQAGVQVTLPVNTANPSAGAIQPAAIQAAGAEIAGDVTVSLNLPALAGGPVGRQNALRNFSLTPDLENVAADGVANIAASSNAKPIPAFSEASGAERNFLTAQNKIVTSAQASTGIGVAKPGANMPANFTARRTSANLPDTVLPIGPREAAFAGNEVGPTPAPAATTSTPAPVLAHRAVETVLNVVEAQNSRPTAATVVNLHFKFGGDDLAVRVQLRGSEVHTQFDTDSGELRTALSNEWRAVTGQGATGSLRLAEPVFSSSGSGSGHGFGSSPHGQSSSQQNPQQQQQAQLPAMFPGLRSLRLDANAAATDAVPNQPRQTLVLPTSQHLAAVA